MTARRPSKKAPDAEAGLAEQDERHRRGAYRDSARRADEGQQMPRAAVRRADAVVARTRKPIASAAGAIARAQRVIEFLESAISLLSRARPGAEHARALHRIEAIYKAMDKARKDDRHIVLRFLAACDHAADVDVAKAALAARHPEAILESDERAEDERGFLSVDFVEAIAAFRDEGSQHERLLRVVEEAGFWDSNAKDPSEDLRVEYKKYRHR